MITATVETLTAEMRTLQVGNRLPLIVLAGLR